MTPDYQIRLMNALRCSRSPSPKYIILIHLPCAQIDRLLSSLRSAQECRGELVRQSAMAAGHHNTHVRLVAEVHGPLGESGTGSRDGGTHRMSVPCKGVTREHWSGAGGPSTRAAKSVVCRFQYIRELHFTQNCTSLKTKKTAPVLTTTPPPESD